MNITSEREHHNDALKLKRQIRTLEDRYVELFLGGSDKELLKRVHLQLKVLEIELKLNEGRHC